MNSFLSFASLVKLGIKKIGTNVKISKYANLYSPKKLSIGNNVRIDDFCFLSGKQTINNNVHISPYVGLWGNININKYCVLSSGCKIYQKTDNYDGQYLMGPIVMNEYRNIPNEDFLNLNDYATIGANSVIMNVNKKEHNNLYMLEEGVCIGASSYIDKQLEPWSIYAGSPMKFLKHRNKEMINLASEYEQKMKDKLFEEDTMILINNYKNNIIFSSIYAFFERYYTTPEEYYDITIHNYNNKIFEMMPSSTFTEFTDVNDNIIIISKKHTNHINIYLKINEQYDYKHYCTLILNDKTIEITNYKKESIINIDTLCK